MWHVQIWNWLQHLDHPFITKLALSGRTLRRQQCLWVCKSVEVNLSGDSFREWYLPCCIWATTYIVGVYDCDWVGHYLGSDSESSNCQGLYAEEADKGDMERADLSSGQLEAACAASELSVLPSGAWCAMLSRSFLFRSVPWRLAARSCLHVFPSILFHFPESNASLATNRICQLKYCN